MNSRTVLLACLALVFVPTISTVAQETATFRILITNDDGIKSPGIAALVEALSHMAEVMVVAPSSDRSGSSHSTEMLRRPTRVTPHLRDGKVFGYAVDGTPADAARFGLLALGAEQPFDLVISGINQGENVGFLSHLSGTVGAAMESLWNAVPAIAVSQSRRRGDDYATAAAFTAKIVAQVRDRGLPPRVMLSINVPSGEIQGAVAARMAESEFRIGYAKAGQEGDATLYYPNLSIVQPKEGGDTQAFMAGYITVTSLRFDWTDYEMLGVLGDWDLSR